MGYDHQPGSPNFDGSAAYEAYCDDAEERYREWLRILEEDVIVDEYGYEPGEFTVYPALWKQSYDDGLSPSEAWESALDSYGQSRRVPQ